MRYNERELLSLARQPAEKAAEILMRVPKKGSVLKKRLVKLVINFLFYFRTDEAEPIGALLLEHCRITKEEENVFSISFVEEPERKYCFECDSEEQCQEWIEALERARTPWSSMGSPRKPASSWERTSSNPLAWARLASGPCSPQRVNPSPPGKNSSSSSTALTKVNPVTPSPVHC
ncbi:pleckstrin homology domain-containing family J member 1 isoform X1 [Phalacrocorax carbo]|uniref:pleckstrin homology domain-containing family J member 1 isoform X1 n=1 Tax=Phalacrocorax carbo TaxID=9209 RepID=UPI00311A4522